MDDFAFLKHIISQNEEYKEIQCEHEETLRENDRDICLSCGRILFEELIKMQSYSLFKQQRKKIECTIFTSLPPHILQPIKEQTVIIYKTVVGCKFFRRIKKQAIALACLHRAAVLANQRISYEELLTMFDLKPSDANHGFSIVEQNLSKSSEFAIRFDMNKEHEMNIASICSHLSMQNHIQAVTSLFHTVKDQSDILETSLSKSVICGCIFFWIKFLNLPKTLKVFADEVKLSEMTVSNKFLAILNIVYGSILRSFLSSLLKQAEPLQSKEQIKSPIINTLYEPELNAVILNPFENPKVQMLANHSIHHLNEVDDITEWNSLLSKKFFTDDGKVIVLKITITKNTRDIIFDFSTFNKVNRLDGNTILKNLVLQKFA